MAILVKRIDVLIQPFRAGEHIALHTADGVLIAACVCFRQSLLLIGNAILVEGQIGGIIAVAPHLVVAFDRGTKKRYHLVDIICQVFVGKYALAQLTVAANYAFDKIFACHQPSVPAAVGQQEAGLVLGMTKRQIFFKVTLLQVIKRVIPPMGNEFINLVKDTALARTIAVYEVLWMGESYIKSAGLMWPLFYTAVFYLAFNGILVLLFGWLEKKLDYFR